MRNIVKFNIPKSVFGGKKNLKIVIFYIDLREETFVVIFSALLMIDKQTRKKMTHK